MDVQGSQTFLDEDNVEGSGCVRCQLKFKNCDTPFGSQAGEGIGVYRLISR